MIFFFSFYFVIFAPIEIFFNSVSGYELTKYSSRTDKVSGPDSIYAGPSTLICMNYSKKFYFIGDNASSEGSVIICLLSVLSDLAFMKPQCFAIFIWNTMKISPNLLSSGFTCTCSHERMPRWGWPCSHCRSCKRDYLIMQRQTNFNSLGQAALFEEENF